MRPPAPIDSALPSGLADLAVDAASLANKIQIFFSFTQTPPPATSAVALKFKDDNPRYSPR